MGSRSSYSDRNFFLGASIGYQMPVLGEVFDTLRGVRVHAGADLTLW